MLFHKCVRCKQSKPPENGQLRWCKTRYNFRYFVCFECIDRSKESVTRNHRKTKESPVERAVRSALNSINIKSEAEFKVKSFTYDFAFPAIRLLLEIDSKTWHSSYHRKQRDKRKDANAVANGWAIARVNTGRKLVPRVIEVVKKRAIELEQEFLFTK